MIKSTYSNFKLKPDLSLVALLLSLFSAILLPAPSYANEQSAVTVNTETSNTELKSRAEELTLQIGAYHDASPVEKLRLAEKIVDQAAERRVLLIEMLDSNSADVFGVIIPDAIRKGMPSEVQVFLEERIELEGVMEVFHEDYQDPGLSRYRYFLNTGDERVAMYFKTEPQGLSTGKAVKAKGLLLPGEDGAMLLESSENITDAVTNRSAGSGSGSPVNTLGVQSTAVLLVNFQDDPNNKPWTTTQANDLVFGEVSDFLYENSYEQTWLTGEVFGWYTLPINSTDKCSVDNIAFQAEAAAGADGVSLSGYDRVIYIFPKNNCGWGGFARIGGRDAWINDAFGLRVVGHELLHTFGLYHSHGMNCDGLVVGNDCPWIEYGDSLDIMGNRAAHINTFQKKLLGWLDNGASPAINHVTTSGTYTIPPYETTGGNSKALKILRTASPQSWLYLEYRQAIGFDSFLSEPQSFLVTENILNGVVFHLVTEGDSNSSFLLDMTVDSKTGSVFSDLDDPALEVGSSYTDSVAGVSISVDSANSGGATVTVNFGDDTCIHNDPDLSLSPSQSQWVPAGTNVVYSATVTNRDSSGCANSGFDVFASNLPAGFTATSNSLNLAPGQTGTVGITVISASSVSDGFYTLGIGTENQGRTNYNANGTVTYVVSSGSGNSAPVAVDDSTILQEVAPVTINVMVNDWDPDNDPLTVVSATNGAKGSVKVNDDGTVTYTPGRHFKNNDNFTYMLSDSMQSSSASVSITKKKSGGKGNGGGRKPPK